MTGTATGRIAAQAHDPRTCFRDVSNPDVTMRLNPDRR
jgi:hypothetical protein